MDDSAEIWWDLLDSYERDLETHAYAKTSHCLPPQEYGGVGVNFPCGNHTATDSHNYCAEVQEWCIISADSSTDTRDHRGDDETEDEW